MFFFGCISNSLNATELDTLSPKNVLILFAFDPAGQVYENITAGLINKIRNDYPHTVNFFIDYAEISRFDTSSHLDDFFEYYNKKYKGFKFDLFISVGPGLYTIVKNRNIPIVDSIPVIYVETFVKSGNFNPIVPVKNETVIYLDIEYEKNIDLGLQLFPDTKNIFIVTGDSEYDKRWLNMYDTRMSSLQSKYNITTLCGLPIKELENRFKSFPENSIVFFPTYQKDTAGMKYYGSEVLREVSKNSNAPIFQHYDIGMVGSIGGFIINSKGLGEKVGEVSVRIFRGEVPDSIGVYHSNFSQYIFDWKQLNRWKIDEKKLPQGSIFINREYTFTEKYAYYLLAVNIFLGLEAVLIIILFYLYRKQKRLGKQLVKHEEQYRTLVDYNRLSELSELTASLSHELNQPLTAILSSSQAAQRFIANKNLDNELFNEILSNIVQDVKRASGIMNSLRGMIKKDTREKLRINLNNIAHDVSQLFSSQAAIKDIKLEIDLDERDPFVLADSILIEQVILNLLINASEALERKERGFKEILLKTNVTADSVTVSVCDNGPGVKKGLEPLIFKPFFSTKIAGLGIGLAICRSIIEDHEGKFSFENNVTGGATFSFKLKTIH